MDETTTRITGVRTVSIPVTDQDRALEFYNGTLGLEVRMDATYGPGQRWIELAAPGADTTIALAPPDPGQSCGVDTGIRLLTSDAEADYEALRSRGATIEGELMRWPNVPAMFMLRDPDDNLLRIIENAPAGSATGESQQALKRYVVLVKSDARTESGVMPKEGELADMTRFNDELVNGGIMLAGEGLHPSTDGARIKFAGGSTSVSRGPFGEPYQLVAGYWVIQAGSLDEAIAIMRRAPMGEASEIEIRQVLDANEFGEAFTPELRERERRQWEKMRTNARRRAA
ncbi:MAG TPA: VOC family protein [Thermoleophilia bacterium]|nr:VOC family protein [Thermoleophilia bacterium]